MRMAQRRTIVDYWPSIVVGIVIVAFLAFWTFVLPPGDLPVTLARYVDQVHAGNGLVFNLSERVLLVASPAYLSIIALLNVAFSSSTANGIVFVVVTLIGAASLNLIAQRAELSKVASTLLIILFLSLSPFVSAVDPPLYVSAMLSLAVFEIALKGRWRLAGLLLAFAVLCNPSAVLLTVPLLLVASDKATGLRFLSALLIPLIIVGFALRM